VDIDFLRNYKLWIHCKDLRTLNEALRCLWQPWKPGGVNFFFHGSDDGVLTSRGFIFTAPGKYITPTSIAVMPELVEGWDISNAAGVCTNYPDVYRKRYAKCKV
jgi:hypothetical protein